MTKFAKGRKGTAGIGRYIPELRSKCIVETRLAFLRQLGRTKDPEEKKWLEEQLEKLDELRGENSCS